MLPSFETIACILPNLTAYVPRPHPPLSTFSHLANLPWADEDPTSSRRIEIIMGADLYADIILHGVSKGPTGSPIAQNSIFGWVITGPRDGDSDPARASSGNESRVEALRCVKAHHCLTSPSLDDELRRFWEWEEIPVNQVVSPLEARCENHFLTSHSRDRSGRYIVRLPFKSNSPIALGESRSIAVKLAHNMERRLKSNESLAQEYIAFMTEYEYLGHMRRAPKSTPSHSPPRPVYIPHHPIIRDDSTTTRVRIVFNASCRTSNGSSLNDHLLTGPKLQTDLPTVILRWRQFKFVYSADIAKMYRQILVDERDLDFQRIVWRSHSESPFSEYQLLTVTYGTACAPYLALRVLKQLDNDEGHAYPLASRILRLNIYVDDILFGANDIESISQARLQLISLLAKGGFSLRKWASNSASLLRDIEPADHGLANDKILSEDKNLKVLGLSWNPIMDQFRFQVLLSTIDPATKRSVLSVIARLYDPLGWVTPVVIKTKLLMQSLWKAKIQWDDPLPHPLQQQWTTIASQLINLNSVKIPRWTQLGADSQSAELHGFADASNAAFAAVVYLRVRLASGEIITTLLASKSKVAPLKPISVPRLELSAAVLLSRLMVYVADTLEIAKDSIFCWSDSSVVLHWLSQHPSRWKVFVANRVSLIQSLLPSVVWRHVPSIQNPADCASRGLYATELLQHSLWWNGPPWLIDDAKCWPDNLKIHPAENDPEEKVTSLHSSIQAPLWDLSTRYSSWPKLIRVTSYVLRFVSLLRSPTSKSRKDPQTDPHVLTTDEVLAARNFWLRQLQRCLFGKQINLLSINKQLPPKDRLLSLRPFLDSENLLRVGGRLTNAPMAYTTRHPILLAPHPLVSYLVNHIHVRALHAGNQLTLSLLRRDYWVLRARNLVRRVISQCVTCTRERAAVPVQLMGSLPSVRVTRPSRAFQHCGLDYAGPFLIRASAGRGISARKAYIALFICLVTRAVHIELVVDYSTEAFLRAFARFCSRRGLPSDIYSDNGTNFVGANRELTRAYRAAMRDPSFLNSTAVEGVSWHFIPPAAPHFGGMWEAGVRSTKSHLSRVMQGRSLTFEEFSTLLARIEACLNSRPIAPLSDTVADYEHLTPGHFLIGTALLAHPEPSVLDVKENRLSRWQLVRQLTERFWKLWQHDYINTLQQRAKWRLATSNVCIGQLVLLRNPALPPGKWELGRITDCYPGKDGLTRVVKVKTASSEYKRPIAQICILPVSTTDHNSRVVHNDVPD